MKVFEFIRYYLVLFFCDRQITLVITQADYIAGTDRATLEKRRKRAAELHDVTPEQEVQIRAFAGKVMISNFDTSRTDKTRTVFLNLDYQFKDFEGKRYLIGHIEVDEQSVGTDKEKTSLFWRKCQSVPNTEAFIKLLTDCHNNYLKVVRLQEYAAQLDLTPETV